jgi:hypothetical protein
MKVLILYRPQSEYARLVEDYIQRFKSRGIDAELEVIDIDSADGKAIASVYDVVQYPAILVVDSDGYLQKNWVGEQLPLLDELIAYAMA